MKKIYVFMQITGIPSVLYVGMIFLSFLYLVVWSFGNQGPEVLNSLLFVFFAFAMKNMAITAFITIYCLIYFIYMNKAKIN